MLKEVRKHFKETYAEVHLQTNSEPDQQKWYYDRATSTVQLMPGEAEYVVVCQVADDVPAYEV